MEDVTAQRDAAWAELARVQTLIDDFAATVDPVLDDAIRLSGETVPELMSRLRDLGTNLAERLAGMTNAGDIAALLDGEIAAILAETVGRSPALPTTPDMPAFLKPKGAK